MGTTPYHIGNTIQENAVIILQGVFFLTGAPLKITSFFNLHFFPLFFLLFFGVERKKNESQKKTLLFPQWIPYPLKSQVPFCSFQERVEKV